MLVGNPNRWRAAAQQMQNRNATAGCLLSVLFAIPYLIKSGQLNTPTAIVAVALYVIVIVPILSGIYKTNTLIYYLRLIFTTVFDWEFWKDAGLFTVFIADWSHFLYLQAGVAHATIMQITFNLAAEKLFCPEQRLCCLYVLLFYSVIAYLHKSIQTRPWAQLRSQNQTSTAELLKLTTVFMIVRLGKAVVMTMVLLTITVQFRHMEPPVDYVALTLGFFCLTQYKDDLNITNSAMEWLRSLNLDWLEGMEELVVPFVLDAVVIGMSGIVIAIAVFTTSSYFVILLMSYTNIWVPWIIMKANSWEPLSHEWRKIKCFPFAPWSHPEIKAGGECAICLDKLRLLSARVTPCGHVFHSTCLRKSLHYTPWCPLCKTPL